MIIINKKLSKGDFQWIQSEWLMIKSDKICLKEQRKSYYKTSSKWLRFLFKVREGIFE
jgi:hypothetical protein